MTKLRPDLCVIGGGSAGLSVAAGAVQMGASVVLVEHGKMGGDCLNSGCVPSKSLLSAAKRVDHLRHSDALNYKNPDLNIDYQRVYDHVHGVIAAIEPHDSVERFEKLGVTVLKGTGSFSGRNQLQVAETTIQAKRFVIATGSSAMVPPIDGLKDTPFLTNETIFELTQLPSHLIVMGGGPIGCELAQAFRLLGSKVTILELARLLPKDDPACVQIVRQHFLEQGIAIHEGMSVEKTEFDQSEVTVTCQMNGASQRITGSHLLVAAGRKPNLEALNLAKAGVVFNPRGIEIDARLRTSNKRIFAIGDVAGFYQFTHVASYHAGIVIRNALFHWPSKVDYRAVPWVTYTSPPLAQVGQIESQLKESGQSYRVLSLPFSEIDRMQAEHELTGFIKVLTTPRGHILGVSMVGEQADELIAPWVLAMHSRLKVSTLATMIVPYPTRSEISKRVAGSFFTPTLFSEKTRRWVRLLNKIFS